MSVEPFMMVPADERASQPYVPATLMQYLSGTSMGWDAISDLTQREAVILQMARDLVCEFGALYPGFILYDRYYRGEPPLANQPERLTRKYKELLHMGVSNWLGLVVDVVDERLQVASVRSSQNAVKDKTAWEWWQRNKMDGISQQVHNAALRYGVAYVSVWPNPGKKYPRIIGESPLTCHVQFDDENTPLAAIRVYKEPCCDEVFLDLTLPDYQFFLVSEGKLEPLIRENYVAGPMWSGLDFTNAKWRFRSDVPPVVINPMGVVPYARLRTMPDLMGGYRSEMEGLIPIADRINKTIFDRLIAQEFAAFPQRWVTGIEVPIDPSTNKPKEPFNAAVDRIWTADSPDAKFGQFDAANLKGYLDSVTADVQALATQSRTPPHYLVAGMGQFPSGESVRATEYGLTRKCQARQQSYGDGWQEVLHLCALAQNVKRLADDEELNVVWKDVEARSEGEIVDALLKMGSLNVPVQALWQRWGASPEEIEQWEKIRVATEAAKAKLHDPAVALTPSIDVAQGPDAQLATPRDELKVISPSSVDTNRIQA